MSKELCVLGAIALAGCTTNVQLHVDNPSKLTVAVSAVEQSNGATVNQLNFGAVPPGGHIDPPIFKVTHNHDLVVQATASGLQAWASAPTTITASPDPRVMNESVNVQAKLLDDADSIKQITDAFSNTGKSYGLNPLSADNAAASIWGAIIVIVPATAGTPANVLYEVPASKFLQVGAAPASVPKITYPATNNSNTKDISGKSAANLAVSFPIIKAGGNFEDDTVYQLKWSLLGYGEDDLVPPAGWSLGMAMADLSAVDVNNIAAAMKGNSKAVLLFVDRLYVLQSGSLSETQGTTLTSGATLNAGSIVTASGAYSFSDATTSATNFANVVLNIYGDEIPADMIKVSPVKPGKASSLTTNLSGADIVGLRFQAPANTPSVLSPGKWSFIDARVSGVPPLEVPKSAVSMAP